MTPTQSPTQSPEPHFPGSSPKSQSVPSGLVGFGHDPLDGSHTSKVHWLPSLHETPSHRPWQLPDTHRPGFPPISQKDPFGLLGLEQLPSRGSHTSSVQGFPSLQSTSAHSSASTQTPDSHRPGKPPKSQRAPSARLGLAHEPSVRSQRSSVHWFPSLQATSTQRPKHRPEAHWPG